MYKFIVIFLFFMISLWAESVNTTLSDPKQIEEFHKVTTQIRCICLPSLPIKSCTFNNCAVSAHLKTFIENRIRAGENADTIVDRLQKGYKQDAINDPIYKKFKESGNESMASGIYNGFGTWLLAEPDSSFINITILVGGVIGIIIIGLYFSRKKRSNSQILTPEILIKPNQKIVQNSFNRSNQDKYLDELDK